MTQITKEAIEAAKAALVKYSVLMPVDAAISDAIAAALPFLPIAGEGKEGWRPIASAPQSGKIVMLAWSPDDWTTGQGFYRDGKWIAVGTFYNHSAGKPPYEFRQITVSPVLWADIGSPSSPGKDGGQDEGDLRIALKERDEFKAEAEDLSIEVSRLERDLASAEDEIKVLKDGGQEAEADEPVAWRYSFDEGVTWNHRGKKPGKHRFGGPDIVQPLYTRPQPASTALVERLTSALQKAENVLEVYADPTGYTDGYGDQVPADAVQHEGLLAQEALDVVRAALSSSQSTSRKGESRG